MHKEGLPAEPLVETKAEYREGVEEVFPGGFRLTYPGAHGLDVPETWAIKTESGLLVIDPGGELPVESPKDAVRAVAGVVTWTHKTPKIDAIHALEKEFDCPVSAVLLTHGDTDHSNNLESVAGPEVPIYADRRGWWSVMSPEKQFKAGVVNLKKSTLTGHSTGTMGQRDALFNPAATLLNNPRSAIIDAVARHDKKKAVGDRLMDFPASFEIDGGTLEVVPTPGHAPGEVGFFIPEHRVFIGGDLITTSKKELAGRLGVFLPDANVYEALVSLDRLAGMDIEQYYPAHGAALIGREKIQEHLAQVKADVVKINTRTIELHRERPDLTTSGLAKQVFTGDLKIPGFSQTSEESWVLSVLRDQPKEAAK